MGRLADKVVVITGAGSGLGRESAQLFSSEGAKVVVMDLLGDRAEQTVKLVTEAGGEAIAVEGDVTQEDDVARTVATTLKEYGRLDVMWANAGIVSRGGVPSVLGGEEVPLTEFTVDDFHEVVNTNLLGPFLCAKHSVKPMAAQGGGAILMTASAAALVAYHSIAAYSASKAGVLGLVRALSLDLGRYGIRVNALAPTHGMSPNFLLPKGSPVVGQSYEETAGPWDKFQSPIPLKLDRPPGLRDNANVALFLVSDESAYMSGVTIDACDGGTLHRVAMQFPEDQAGTPQFLAGSSA